MPHPQKNASRSFWAKPVRLSSPGCIKSSETNVAGTRHFGSGRTCETAGRARSKKYRRRAHLARISSVALLLGLLLVVPRSSRRRQSCTVMAFSNERLSSAVLQGIGSTFMKRTHPVEASLRRPLCLDWSRAVVTFASYFGMAGSNDSNEGDEGGDSSFHHEHETDSSSDRQTNEPNCNSTALSGSGKNHDVTKKELLNRIVQLESLVARQAVDIRRLSDECKSLNEAAASFLQVVELLRQAGLTMDGTSLASIQGQPPENGNGKPHPSEELSDNDERTKPTGEKSKAKVGSTKKGDGKGASIEYEYFEDSEIFGSAPSSVIDAADAAGAAILAALLGGKQQMLVDVRDAELSRDPDILVQFIELAILPVAAGLEGLKADRNRVKIVFPTVSQLLQYRRSMALAAPEVVSLSTLAFDPVEDRDNLVVIVAPSPDDSEGLRQMNELLSQMDDDVAKNASKKRLTHPVVVLNHYMVPVSGPASEFEVAYHLRLLSVQYMAGGTAPDYVQSLEREIEERKRKKGKDGDNANKTGAKEEEAPPPNKKEDDESGGDSEAGGKEVKVKRNEEDAALEAAMNHARELGVHQGLTRAMVIRAYPRPWHVFVDTSPDTDADFEVAATFDEEPSQDDVNFAIVECLEGSEREDELVAQQMQQALEAGQLNKVSEMLGISNVEVDDDDDQTIKKQDGTNDEEDGGFYDDWFNEDSC